MPESEIPDEVWINWKRDGTLAVFSSKAKAIEGAKGREWVMKKIAVHYKGKKE